ncbi:MAG: T9SS C-terminal target domain-containing protein [Calditrichaeota bacterium]|nr:MAG: T9SS C-terminal target domain-containing protein [Calditrichota bacterium]
MGSNAYKGFEGGLYPGGTNTPPAGHAQAGMAIAKAIRPLNKKGNVDAQNGAIVLVTIGMSNTRRESEPFVARGMAEARKNPKVILVNGAKGGQSADKVANPNADYWNYVRDQLSAASLTPQQVQIAWVKEALKQPKGDFQSTAGKLQGYLEDIARTLKLQFPNIKIVYYSSRIYAGYASSSLNPEPYAYESGFAVKWAIAKQIQGDANLNYDPAKGKVVAPYMAWGPYFWADGLTPRSDGLPWDCKDFDRAGTHPSTRGAEKVAGMLVDFLKTDPTATPWFLQQNTTPVQLSSFEAQMQGAEVLLRWQTSAAIPGLLFEVQRQANQQAFEKIATVSVSATGNPANIYQYRDAHLAPGKYRYRLKILEPDGTSSFSGTVSVEISQPQGFEIVGSYPNPFVHRTRIQYRLAHRAQIRLQIFNALGQRVAELQAGRQEAGVHQVEWNGLDQWLRPVPNGMYFITLREMDAPNRSRFIARKKLLLVR